MYTGLGKSSIPRLRCYTFTQPKNHAVIQCTEIASQWLMMRTRTQFALFIGVHMRYHAAVLCWLLTMFILAGLEVAYAVRLILQLVESNDLRFITIGQIVCQFLLVCE